jgi:hypothetical protein
MEPWMGVLQVLWEADAVWGPELFGTELADMLASSKRAGGEPPARIIFLLLYENHDRLFVKVL